jgi:CHAT domain-containing protein
LHFQAAYLAARLHVLLAAFDDHVLRLNELLAASVSETNENIRAASLAAATTDAADHFKQAIEFLTDAVAQAEAPASSTTHQRLERARFFTRYAPAYDLLVDLHVAIATRNADRFLAVPGSAAFDQLRQAIEVADQARNRTFREQIDGWRGSPAPNRFAARLDWAAKMPVLAPRGTVLLVFHLDGPQPLGTGGSLHRAPAARIGGGHLFAIRDQGREIRYYRLQHTERGATRPVALTRQSAADLVRRHLAWIERPETAVDWGREHQRALTEALLPRELLETLLSPSTPASGTAARKLLVIPDGALHQLPFESLLLPQDLAGGRELRYALDELPPIRYGPSLSVLAAIAQGAGQGDAGRTRLVTVGNPAYPDRRRQSQIPAWSKLFQQVPGYRGGFDRLTHSADECESVYASFDDTTPGTRIKLTQTDATEAAVRQHLAASQFVHLAAHGCVDYENDNLFGALVFTPGSDPADPRNDGLLQLADIYSLDLSRCELAVLSACQTYVGPERPLEAGTSMARAFLEQGARRVVCSQWATDDEATTKLMSAFFAEIRQARQAGRDVDYALALHAAKRAVRADPARGAMPKFWSPFVLVGAP